MRSLSDSSDWVTPCSVGIQYVCVHAFKCDKSQLNPGLIKITAAVIILVFPCYSTFTFQSDRSLLCVTGCA